MPPITPKTKADDYLQELASQCGEEWLKALIERVLLLRDVPEEAFLDAVYVNFGIAQKLRRFPAQWDPKLGIHVT